MDINDKRIQRAVRLTEILRAPRRKLATFGATTISYYIVSEPSYADFVKGQPETVVREGRVVSERPKIVTPLYLANLEGFSSSARRYFQEMVEEQDSHAPGIYYSYRNEPKGLNVVSGSWLSVVDNMNREIDRSGDPLVAIIKGEDDLWDVSLMKFIYDMTRTSVQDNVAGLDERGLLNRDAQGVTAGVRQHIEEMFFQVKNGEVAASELKTELDRWGLFDDYEDRFLRIFRR